MIPSNIAAVIFDFDGVIVDTEEIGIRVSADLFKQKFNIRLTEQDRTTFYGMPDLQFYTLMLQKYGITAEPDRMLQEHNQVYDDELAKIRTALPGVVDTVQTLKARGLTLGICSGSYNHQILTLLHNLGLVNYFDTIISYERTSLHKPHPDPYLHTAQGLHISPRACLVFEDSENGVCAAKRAGMYVIGVQIGNHGTQDLGSADRVIYSFRELVV